MAGCAFAHRPMFFQKTRILGVAALAEIMKLRLDAALQLGDITFVAQYARRTYVFVLQTTVLEIVVARRAGDIGIEMLAMRETQGQTLRPLNERLSQLWTRKSGSRENNHAGNSRRQNGIIRCLAPRGHS